MKILLIGGTGIISSEICDLCLNRGYDVTIVNRGRRKEFINPKATLLIADIRNESVGQLKSKLAVEDKNKSFDVVVDFLSYTVAQMEKTMAVFAPICKQYIFISSAVVYSDCNGAISENDPIDNNKWIYAVNKAACEKYLEDHAEKYNVKYTIIRPYITYNRTRIPYQIAPLEYYTIVNRILCGKPLPLYGDDVKCTLTSSKDFAKAAVGLFMNLNAFGQAYHITGDCVLTWKEVGLVLSKIYGAAVEFINLPDELLSRGSKKLGFDVEEIIGDKGRNMVFDNSKIKNMVPEFRNTTDFMTGIMESKEYYDNNPQRQKVNYEWEGRIDRVMSKAAKSAGISTKKLHLNAYGKNISLNNRLTYIFNRYDLLRPFYVIVRKISRKINNIFCN